jgi:iron complex transport system substrate-binding protein
LNFTWKKQIVGISLLTLMAAGVTGCASNSPSENTKNESAKEQTSDLAAYPLTVSNYSINDGVWTAKDQVFKATPSRVVANNQSTAELLIRLGLTDSMVGVAALYGETNEDIAEEFSKIPVLNEEYVGKELTLGANPDLVIGRGDLFADSEWGVGTVDELNSLGVHTFIFNTCQRGATLDALFKDIEEVGRIFNVQENAATFADGLHTRIDQLTTKLSGVEKTLTYSSVSYSDGTVTAYAGTSDTFQNDALNLIKLDNAFKNASGEITLEQLVSTNPDILLISRYAGGPNPEESIASIYKMPSLQSLSAVKNHQIYIIDFSEFWGYSYQILDGVETLASDIYPDLMK